MCLIGLLNKEEFTDMYLKPFVLVPCSIILSKKQESGSVPLFPLRDT